MPLIFQPPLAQAGTITLLALGLGTLAGGFLPTLFQDLPAEEAALLTPLSTTLLLSLALRLLLLILIGLSVEEPRHRSAGAGGWGSGFADVPRVISEALTLSRHNNILLALMGATVVGGFTLAAVETFWQPRFALLLDADSTQSWLFGLLMTISFAMGMGGNMLATPLSRRLHHRYGVLAGLARGVQSLALIVMALAIKSSRPRRILAFLSQFRHHEFAARDAGQPGNTSGATLIHVVVTITGVLHRLVSEAAC